MPRLKKKVNVDEAVLNFLKYANDHNLLNNSLKRIDPVVFDKLSFIQSNSARQLWNCLRIIIWFLTISLLVVSFVVGLFMVAYNLDVTPTAVLAAYDYLIFNYFEWNGVNPFGEKCVVDVEHHIPHYMDITRKPHSCGFCANIHGARRLKRVSPEKFVHYVEMKQPIIITDAMSNWSAPSTFSYDFFKRLYGEVIPEEEYESYENGCQFFPYRTEFKSLRDVFTISEERSKMSNSTKPWYVGWSNCWPSAAIHLRQHYSRPYFLPKFSESTRIDWIFMGSVGYGANLHVDDVSHPSWQAQIKGTKIWTLKPPLECLSICNSFDILVKPGEIIVLDTNVWYHATLIVGKEMSITIGSEFD